MLTEEHVRKVFHIERKGLESWHGDGDQGTPWGKLIAFDTTTEMPSVMVSHAKMAKSPIITNRAAGVLETGTEATSMFMVYYGLTLLPDDADKGIWNSQEQLNEMFLHGHPKAGKIGKGLHVIGVDNSDTLKISVQRYSTDGGTVAWGKSLYAECPKENLKFDLNVSAFTEGREENTGTWETVCKKMPPKDRMDTRHVRMTRLMLLCGALTHNDCSIMVKREPWMLEIEDSLAEDGVQFVG